MTYVKGTFVHTPDGPGVIVTAFETAHTTGYVVELDAKIVKAVRLYDPTTITLRLEVGNIVEAEHRRGGGLVVELGVKSASVIWVDRFNHADCVTLPLSELTVIHKGLAGRVSA